MRHQTALIKDLITSRSRPIFISSPESKQLGLWGSVESSENLWFWMPEREKMNNRLARKLIFRFLRRGRLWAPVPPGFGFVNIKLLAHEPLKCHIGICLGLMSHYLLKGRLSARHAFFSRVWQVLTQHTKCSLYRFVYSILTYKPGTFHPESNLFGQTLLSTIYNQKMKIYRE